MNAPQDLRAIARTAIDGAVFLPVELVRPSPTNPRKHFDQQHLQELADSLAKVGQISPIVVRPVEGAKAGDQLYEIVAGERRWRACKLASLGQVMALVRELTDFEVLELQVIENLQRDDLHPLEEAEGYAALLRKPDGLHGYANAEELAVRIGKSRRYVYNRLQLLKLCDEVKQACFEGRISASVALVLSSIPADDQPAAAKRCEQGWGGEPLSARGAAAYLRESFSLQLKKAVFPIADAGLVPSAGACTDCPKRTTANPDLFTDQADGGIDSCLDRKCFDAKAEAHHAILLAAHRAQGREILQDADAKKLMPYGQGSLRGAYKLAEPCDLASSRKPLAELLGNGFDKVVVLDLYGELTEVVREADARKALKSKGLLKPPAKKEEPKAQEPERVLPKPAKGKELTTAEVKKAREVAIAERWPEVAREQLAKRLLNMEQPVFTERMQRMLAAQLAYGSNEPLSELLHAAGIANSDAPSYPDQEQVQAMLEQASLQQAYALSVLSLAEADVYMLRRDPKAEVPMRTIAAELGFDLAPAIAEATREIEERVKAELGDAKPAKPAPAAKKAAKPKDATQAFVEAHEATQTPAGAAKLAAKGIKYVCPDTGSTWSGRGLQPKWVKAALEAGRTLADLAVIPPAGKTTLNPDAVRTELPAEADA